MADSETPIRWSERVLGRMSYAPPAWWGNFDFKTRLNAKASAINAWDKAHPQIKFKITGALLALGALWLIFALRPKPKYLSLNISAPPATEMKKDARPQPLILHFNDSAADLAQIGEIPRQGIDMSPPQRGTWTWATDRVLRFDPAEDWPPAQEYKISMSPKLFAPNKRPHEWRAKFRTAPFTMTLKKAAFYQDPADPTLKKIIATLKFSHAVDPVSLQERLSIETARSLFGVKTLPLSVTYDELRGEAYIHSERVAVEEKERVVTLVAAAGVRAEKNGAAAANVIKQPVAIPSIYTVFLVEGIDLTVLRNPQYEPEQALILSFTTGARESEIIPRLDAFLLPKDNPAHQGRGLQKDYWWSSPGEIGPEILAQSQKLALEPLPTDREHALTHSFKLKADPGRRIYVRLRKGAEAFGGYKLAQTFDSILEVPEFPKEVQFMHEGALLSLFGDKTVRLLARGVPAVKFEVSRVRAGQINHFVTQSHGRYDKPGFQWNFGPDHLSERFEIVREFQGAGPADTRYASVDLAGYLADQASGRGLFYLKANGWDPQKKEIVGPEDQRVILVTDMGLIVKEEAAGSRAVFVQSLKSGGPVEGARVDVLGINGEAVASQVTGADGRVDFPSFEGFEREKTPSVITARKGADLSFIPFSRPDRYLDMSRFDTGGLQAQLKSDALQAYLFSDRGIYRPGDEFKIGLIVKGADWKTELQGIPLEAAIVDARGVEVHKERFRLSKSAFEEFRFKTDDVSPTGAWRFSVYIVKDDRRRGLLDSTSVRIEEFLPDRLRIESRFSTERRQGWVHPADLKGLVALKTLYGTPAAGHAVSARLRLSPSKPEFAAYPGFVFADPNRDAQEFEERLQDTATDGEGNAVVPLGLERFTGAVYALNFYAEGFEASGARSVASQSSVLVSDRKFLLGFNPAGRLDFVHRASTRPVRVIAVGPDLSLTAAEGLSLHFYERQTVSALRKQEDGTFRYESVVKETQVSSAAVSVGLKGLSVDLLTGKAGEFRVALRENGGPELLEWTYSVVADANVSRSLEKSAQLQVTLARSDYRPGEFVEMQLKAPYAGAGLITLEKESVYAHRWFRAETTAALEKIRLPEGLEGNGYVSVAWTRAANSPEIYLKPLSYAAAPFTVARDQRKVDIEFENPAEVKPGEPFTIRFRTDKPSRIVVFAVDEGILQAAGYKTPAPLDKFLAKRALEVRTAQILDLILPDYASVPGLKAPGGDGYEALGKNLNPFKRRRQLPAVFWSGIVEAGKDWRELVYQAPDEFNGSLRLMAVAVAPDAVGVAEKKILARASFVITPQVPLFMAPGDKAWVSAAVMNNSTLAVSGNIELKAAASRHLKVLGADKIALSIAPGKEALARFEVEALNALGAADIEFKASAGGESSKLSATLSVRPAAPYRRTVQSAFGRRGKAVVDTTRRMHEEFRELKAALSPLPLGLAHGLAGYLQNYPYACTEQLVSRAFGALALKRRPEFGYSAGKADEGVREALSILRARQNPEGAFGVWAANSHVSEFHAPYAMHFITEAEASGIPVDRDLLRKGEAFLDRLGAREVETLSQARDSAYALYVLTRRGHVRTRALDALLERYEKQKFPKGGRDLTLAYLAGAYQLLRLEAKAERLMRGFTLGSKDEDDFDNYYDALRRDGHLLQLWSRHFPEKLRKIKGEELEGMLKVIQEERFNTVSAAAAVMGFDAYAAAVGNAPLGAQLFERLEAGKEGNLPIPSGLFPSLAFSSAAVSLRFENSGPDLLFHQVSVSGFDLKPPKEAIRRRLEIHREFRDASGAEITEVRVGDDVTVVLRLRSLDADHSNIAVVDLLPGGFEVVRDPEDKVEGNARIAVAPSSWVPEYADVREDRVVLFGSVSATAQEFRYRIRAVNAGRFAFSPAFAESMYDRTVEARSLGGFFVNSERP